MAEQIFYDHWYDNICIAESTFHWPHRVLMCIANDLLVWKHSLVAYAGATFTIFNNQFCAVLILRHCWHLHTRIECCHCCSWISLPTRIGRRGITTRVRRKGANHLTMTLEGPATEPVNHFAGQVHLELVVFSLLKHFEGCSVLIVTDSCDPCVCCPENGATGRYAAM